ncbi:unnamed protein product [Rotaria magnacalcarata]|uniref:6-phosphofructo-2-kinase domain-containing protein n=1 Tax=Rotaria magnacalcarata TaxID=392030 RepID=A0A8S2QSW5_9BILA|nr:unnamed protein product [Rotaria magnacalcarata]
MSCPLPCLINQSESMSNQQGTIAEKSEEQDDNVSEVEPQKDTMTSSEKQTAKVDVYAWRKRPSYTYQRHPLLSRRISQACRDRLVRTPTVIAMCGLPARGKTYISKKLARYLQWIGIKTKVFNVGEYRRDTVKFYADKDFFDPDNAEAVAVRNQCAQQALEDMCSYLSDDGEVAIFDATNTTRERRRSIYEYCSQTFCFRVFFVESICDSSEIVNLNIRVC